MGLVTFSRTEKEKNMSEQTDRLEQEIVKAVSRGANTINYVMSEINPGYRRQAKQVLYQALDEDKIVMTIDRHLHLP